MPSRRRKKKPFFFNSIRVCRVREDPISSIVESLSIGLSNSGNQEEARSRLRQFGSGLNNNKDLLSRYDVEKLNEV